MCGPRTTVVRGRGPPAFSGDNPGTRPVHSTCSAVSGQVREDPGTQPVHSTCSAVSGRLAFVYRGQGTERHTLTPLGKLSHSGCLLGKGTLGERQLPPCMWHVDCGNLVPKEAWQSCSVTPGAGQIGLWLVTKLSAPGEASYLQKPTYVFTWPSRAGEVAEVTHPNTCGPPLLQWVLGCPQHRHIREESQPAERVVRWHPTTPP